MWMQGPQRMFPIGVILGLYWGYIGIMEKIMDTTNYYIITGSICLGLQVR